MRSRPILPSSRYLFFFFNDTATTEIYTLSLHDALPISLRSVYKQLLVRVPPSVSGHTLPVLTRRARLLRRAALGQQTLPCRSSGGHRSSNNITAHREKGYALPCCIGAGSDTVAIVPHCGASLRCETNSRSLALFRHGPPCTCIVAASLPAVKMFLTYI